MPDGSTVVPVGSSSAHGLPHPLDVSVSSMSSSATSTNLDLEKGAMNGVDTLSKDSKRRKIRLAPGYNPPEKDLYHYAPIFRAFERTSLSLFGPHDSLRSHVDNSILSQPSLNSSTLPAASPARSSPLRTSPSRSTCSSAVTSKPASAVVPSPPLTLA